MGLIRYCRGDNVKKNGGLKRKGGVCIFKQKWYICVGCIIFVILYVLVVNNYYTTTQQVMHFEQAKTIIEHYPYEIAYVEQQCGIEISTIDREALEHIKHIAAYNLENEDFKFKEMMTCIADACSKFGPWWGRAYGVCSVCGEK